MTTNIRPLHIGKFVPPPYAGVEAHIDVLLRSLRPEAEATLMAGESPAAGRAAPPPLPYRVLTARSYYMVDYNVAEAKLADACALTPGLDAPTVSPLAKPGWVAVRAMIPRQEAPQIMDRLYDVGADAILVTDIVACRL